MTEREDTMKAITELTVAALAVAFLVALAVEIDHAQAKSSVPVVQNGGTTAAQAGRLSRP
jgi:hypothetical protein